MHSMGFFLVPSLRLQCVYSGNGPVKQGPLLLSAQWVLSSAASENDFYHIIFAYCMRVYCYTYFLKYILESNSGRHTYQSLNIRMRVTIIFIGAANAANSCPDNSFYENKCFLTKSSLLVSS